jgi:hypothetical protein
VTVIQFDYRVLAETLARGNVNCAVSNDGRPVGDVWLEERDRLLWVHLKVAAPITPINGPIKDEIERCTPLADLQAAARYPGRAIFANG